MTRTLQLGNADNWQQIFNISVAAVTFNSAYVPIPEITAPLLLETHVLATYITTFVPAGRTWNFAGFLNQKFEIGLTVGGTPEADVLTQRKLWLNKIQLIILPKLTANYAISFDVPKWFKSVQITAWQYIGVDYDSAEQVLSAEVMPALTRIESKIDSL